MPGAAAASCLLEILIASSPKLQHLTLSWCQMTLSGGYGGTVQQALLLSQQFYVVHPKPEFRK